MAPRPYSDRSVLPRDSSNSSVSVESDTAQTTADSSPGSLSAATTPSPVDNGLLTDINANTSEIEDDDFDILHSNAAFYPTPADSMPFDHAFPDFIRQLTNERNLANVHCLRLRVISRLVSLQRVSLFTTNLRELDLEGSILGSLRDIGCNLKHLHVLKVGNCKLDSLDGTFGLTSLRRLYAQSNMITDVSPCSNLPHIQHIDVSHNRIRNIGYAGFLSVCRKLKTIVFTGNPATQLPDYRDHVRRLLPQLQSLDDVIFSEDEMKLQQGELEDFYEMSMEDQNDFYCNSFEREDACTSSGVKNDSVKDVSTDRDFEIQKSLKFDSKGFHGKESNLLSLRRERDENKQVLASRWNRGVNVNYEEMEDIAQNSSVSNWVQSGGSFDDFTLPPLNVNEKDLKKTGSTEKETVLLGTVDCSETQSKFGERAASFPTGDLQESDTLDFMAMGARPKTLVRLDKPFTATSPSSCGSSSSSNLDAERDGVKKRPSTAGSCIMPHESDISAELDESFGKNPVFKSLTSGSPICGNLTVALRNRKKKQDMEDAGFFMTMEEEPEVPQLIQKQ